MADDLLREPRPDAFDQTGAEVAPDALHGDRQHRGVVLDVELPAGAQFSQRLPAGHNAFLFTYRGAVTVGDKAVPTGSLAILENVEDADGVQVRADAASRFILIAGQPLNEPIAQYGPFVMNTQAEIAEAFADYRRTQFGGWPWGDHAPVHPRDAGRFARHGDGRAERPEAPSAYRESGGPR